MYDPGYRYEILMPLDAVTVTLFISANLFNYINLTEADNSGMLRFLTDELQDAEDKGDRGTFISRVLCCNLPTSLVSLDHRPRSLRLGWNRPIGNIN